MAGTGCNTWKLQKASIHQSWLPLRFTDSESQFVCCLVACNCSSNPRLKVGLRIKYQIKFQRAASDIDNQPAGSQFVNRNCSCPEMPLGRTATKTSISIILISISIISISTILILIVKMLTFVGQSANDEILAQVVSKLFSYFSSGGRVFKLSDHAMYTIVSCRVNKAMML